MTYASTHANEWGNQSVPRSVKKAETLVSSLGGFSDGGPQNVRSLHDLLQAIQPLHLELFQGTDLPEDGFLGEGASYRVKKCTKRTAGRASGEVFAVKQVKLPLTSDREAFQSRVACVLKDIEVMSHPPLVQCDHILGLFGYGWRHQGGDIPFLVTEYAPRGTLRQFLVHNEELSGRNRFGFCRHVGSGLEWLHFSGVCHGDLKLENILVTDGPPNEAGDVRTTAIAKISDFGHSLLLSSTDTTRPQRYLGTALYHPPEVSRERADPPVSINFQKCDLWAFGLLCWETMDGGRPYYENDHIYRLLWKTDYTRGDFDHRHATAEAVIKNLHTIQEQIPEISKHFAMGPLQKIVPPFTQRQVLNVLRSTLVLDPEQRIGDVTALPLAWRATVAVPAPAAQLVDRSKKLSDWGFECFERWNSSRILWSVKEQMVSDFYRSATSSGHSNSTARGAFQYALALLLGFGVAEDRASFSQWLQKSQISGFKIAALVNKLFRTLDLTPAADSNRTLNSSDDEMRDQNALHQETETGTYTTALGNQRLKRFKEYYLNYSNFLRDCFQCRNQDSSTKVSETHSGLLYACRIGSLVDVRRLLTAGADPRVQDSDGCTTLHWLFMFPTAEIEDAANLLHEKATDLALKEDPYIYIQKIDEWLNCRCNKAVVVDPQLPFEVSGSPLAVGVAAASYEMVESLLSRGANPRIDSNLNTNRPRCPLLLSAYLHLPDIFDLLLHHQGSQWRNIPGQRAVAVPLMEGLFRAICDCSFFERLLIHGRQVTEHRSTILRVMFELLYGERLPSHEYACLERAVSYYDLDLTDTLTDTLLATSASFSLALRVSRDKSPTSFPIYLEIMTKKLLAAVDTACRSIYSPDSSIALISKFTLDKDMLNWTDITMGNLRPIDVVIKYRHEAIFDWLLNMDVQLRVQDGQGRTPLHHILGIENFGIERLEHVLSSGAEPNVQDKEGLTPLHLAIRKGACREVQILLKHGADIELQDQYGKTAVHYASESGDGDILAVIVAAAPSLNTHTKDGLSALSTACLRGHFECARLLLGAGVTPESGIHAAVESGRADMVSLLLNSSTETARVLDYLPYDSSRGTPLSLAAFHGNVEIVELLIGEHASLSLQDRRGRTALHHVFIGKEIKCEAVANDAWSLRSSVLKYDLTVKVLLSKFQVGQPRVNIKDDQGRTCLHYAAMCQPTLEVSEYNTIIEQMILLQYQDSYSLIPNLLRSGVNPHIADGHRRQSLHYAVQSRNLDGVYTLLKEADESGVNDKDNDGNTPLNLAVKSYQEPWAHQLMAIYTIFVLLALNADATISNSHGQNPYRAISSQITLPHHQQLIRARMNLSTIGKSRITSDVFSAIEDVLLAAVQITPKVARGRSALQLWAAQVTLRKGYWPGTEILVTTLGGYLLSAGTDLFGTIATDDVLLKTPPLIQVLSLPGGITLLHETFLARWLLREHNKSVQQLVRQLDPNNKLPVVLKPRRILELIKRHVQIARESMNYPLTPDMWEIRDNILKVELRFDEFDYLVAHAEGGTQAHTKWNQPISKALKKISRN